MSDILLVGAGNLGTALLQGWIFPDPVIDSAVVVTKTATPRAQELAGHARLHFMNGDCCPDIEARRIVIMAVKPALMREAYDGIKAHLQPDHRVVSVAAGVKLETLKTIDPSKKWCRAMPSLAAAQRRAVTALYAADNEIENLFAQLGKTIPAHNDRDIDFATLLGASGPGVMAWQAQNWLQAAVSLGLEEDQARLLIKGMIEAGAALLEDSNDFSEIVSRVATKGGTTEAMIAALKKDDVQSAVKDSLQAGLNKIAEISAS